MELISVTVNKDMSIDHAMLLHIDDCVFSRVTHAL